MQKEGACHKNTLLNRKMIRNQGLSEWKSVRVTFHCCLSRRVRSGRIAAQRPPGVALLSVLTAVMSQFCVLLDSVEEDGGLHRFVCLLNQHPQRNKVWAKLSYQTSNEGIGFH